MIELEADTELMPELQEKLSSCTGPGELLVSQRAVCNALNAFVNQKVSAEEIRVWAEALELREEVAYEKGLEGILADVVFRLATPEINEPISVSLCRELRSKLRCDQ